MEKIVILYSNRVENYLKNLIDILFLGEYFGFEESAVKYVEKIYDAIEVKIHLNQFKPSPKELQKHGKFYISYSSIKERFGIFFSIDAKIVS